MLGIRTVLLTRRGPHACLCVYTGAFQLYAAMRENAPSFEDGQSWGGETEDGIVHNKVTTDFL